MQRFCQPSGVFRNLVLHQLADGMGGINRNTVPGMHAGPFDMLHNTGNQDIRAVTYGIHLDFLSL